MNDGLQYLIQINSGNSSTELDKLDKGVGSVTNKVIDFRKTAATLGLVSFAFNEINRAVEMVGAAFQRAIEPGSSFNLKMQELKAITNATDSQMVLIEKNARSLAKTFGVDAATGVESFKAVLSQLSPELAKSPEALRSMGESSAVLSKQMGNDQLAATEVLTTAMNQYGISMDDPIKASRTMAEMMNIMSAAAQQGSAEMPQIKSALEQSGMMAKTSNVQFNELNAAIQLLDKSGKKGAEGGVAIRNMLAEMALGAKQPKAVQDAVAAYGVDLNKAADTSKSFQERLQVFKPLMHDQALMTQLFGKENVAAAMALIQGNEEMGKMASTIVGTQSAYEAANTIMDSHSEKMNRQKAFVNDLKISFFKLTEPFIPIGSAIGNIIGVATPLFTIMSSGAVIMESKLGSAFAKTAVKSWGFVRSLIAGAVNMSLSIVRTGVLAAMMLGGFITSIISATAAQLGLNVAMTANPIGLIVVGVAAAIGAIAALVYWWDEIKSAISSFATWVWNHHPFHFLFDVVGRVFPGFKKAMSDLWNWISEKFKALTDWAGKAIDAIAGLFGGDKKTATTVQGKVVADTKTEGVSTFFNPASPIAPKSPVGSSDVNDKSSGKNAQSITSGGTRNNYITVGKFQDQTVIHTTKIEQGIQDLEKMMQEMFFSLLNSTNTAQS